MLGTIKKILETNYKRTAPAEVQQKESMDQDKSDYKGEGSKNTADLALLVQSLLPLVQVGVLPKDLVKQAITSPTMANIQKLLEILKQQEGAPK